MIQRYDLALEEWDYCGDPQASAVMHPADDGDYVPFHAHDAALQEKDREIGRAVAIADKLAEGLMEATQWHDELYDPSRDLFSPRLDRWKKTLVSYNEWKGKP